MTSAGYTCYNKHNITSANGPKKNNIEKKNNIAAPGTYKKSVKRRQKRNSTNYDRNG